jgi:eukaryotic-like serine/threonine-protein kinase
MSESDLLIRARGRVGTMLCAKYRLDSVLGVGGMAVVFAATHRNQKRVAIKVLHPELSIHEELRTRFLREGYAANTVDHPGAVAVLDDDTAEDGSAFLVMELLEGATTEELWERRGHRLPARMVLAIGDQLLDVLTVAHANGVVHRDLKPANVFVTKDQIVKVLDFGIARLRDATTGHSTQTGAMLGTPAFMAPEQALGKASEIDPRTDLWAVGATLFSLISGALVHEGDNPHAILVGAATRPARSLASVVPDVPPHVVAMIGKALAFDKKDRWPSAAAMREGLRAAYSVSFGSSLPSTSRAPSPELLGTVMMEPSEPVREAIGSRPSFDPATETTLAANGPALARSANAPIDPTVDNTERGMRLIKLSTTAGVESARATPSKSRKPSRLWPMLAFAAAVSGVGVLAAQKLRTSTSTPSVDSGSEITSAAAVPSVVALAPIAPATGGDIAPTTAPAVPPAAAVSVPGVPSTRAPNAPAPKPRAPAADRSAAVVPSARPSRPLPPSAPTPTPSASNQVYDHM